MRVKRQTGERQVWTTSRSNALRGGWETISKFWIRMLSGTYFVPSARRVQIARDRILACCACLPGKSAPAVAVSRERRLRYARMPDRDITSFDSIPRELLLLAIGKCPDHHQRPWMPLCMDLRLNAAVQGEDAALQSRNRAMPKGFNCFAPTGTCFAASYC